MNSEFGSYAHGIDVYGRQGGNSHLKFYNGRRNSVCNILIDGNLDVGSGSSSKINVHAANNGYTGYAELKAQRSYDMYLNLSTTYPNGGWMYFTMNGDSYLQLSGSDNKVNIYKDSTSGNLDVGPSQTQSRIKAYVNHAGHQGNVEIHAKYNSEGYIHFNTTDAHGLLSIATKDVLYLYCGLNVIYFHKPTTNPSGDRLKRNEESIDNACETFSKLRPQLYDKKPDIDNNGPTTWYKESGLIAQEIYYDAPELRHLVHRGKPELDEEGNSIPLPEIPTSIDPQQDPDYSSWGEDPASVNYIGLIAYLVKANIESHERVKALEAK